MRMLYLVGLLLVCTGAQMVHAAHVYLDPEGDTHNRLDTFYIPIRIDTGGECINAVDVALVYDTEELTVHDVAIGDSILTLWTKKPTIERSGDDGAEYAAGRVSFEGGIPGGYCGRVEGDPGLTNVLARLVVSGTPQALPVGVATTTRIIVEPSSVAYAHDGSGTPLRTTHLGTTVVLIQSTSTPSNIWLADIAQDITMPEPFEITLVKGPSVGNKYHYIVFRTVDKQSGVDHYEVLETDPDRFGFLSWLPREAHWAIADSPYVLRDQHLRSKIQVRAVDKKGNVRTETYIPPISPLAELSQPSFLIPLVLLAIVCLVLIALYLRRKRRKKTTVLPKDEGDDYSLETISNDE